jgi:hypothetical protein
MNTSDLRVQLENLTVKKLKGLAGYVFAKNISQLRTKDQLIDKLMTRPKEVERVLGKRPGWWGRFRNEVYGVAGVLGVVLGVATYYDSTAIPVPPKKESGQKSETFPKLSASMEQEVHQQVEAARNGKLIETRVENNSQSVIDLTDDLGSRIFYANATDMPTATSNEQSFEITSQLQVCDLRRHKKLESFDILHDMGSPVTKRVRLVVRKIKDDGGSFLVLAHTSGRDVFGESGTHQ